jgi:hydrophobic/amphiphilic exporter-1 (mainly G- bacteria), HAE1 family
MQWLANTSIRRPVFASVLIILVLVFGVLGYFRLGVDEFPNVDVPIAVITTRLPGASPAEVETEISDKIEGAVSTISGIDELRSTSSEGYSVVIVSFKLDKNSDVGVQEVRDKLDQVMPQLPKGTDPPVVSRVDTGAGAVMILGVSGDMPTRDLTEIADKQVRRRIEGITGVGQVDIVGGRKRQINLWLKPVAMQGVGITSSDVQRALATQNLTVPGGSLESGPDHIGVRVQGRVESVDQLRQLVVREGRDRSIKLEDVARIEDSEAEEESAAAFDGKSSLILSVRKQSGQNTLAVVDTILKKLDDVRALLPTGVKLDIIRDNSGVVRTGTDAVKEHLIIGALLASIVVLFFLGNLRSAIIAAIAIPVSVIGTFMVMYLAGYTLNFLTLLALALAVGIVIDDAIVVLENIVRYVDEFGMKPFPAAIAATKEIAPAVLATTLSLMAVFVPVAFMSGIVGRFLGSFGLTMAFSIGISMFVSFTLTPMLSARWIRKHQSRGLSRVLETIVNGFYKPIERAYMSALRFSMKRRWVIVLACVVSLGSCIPIGQRVPGGFLPEDDNAQFEVAVRGPEGQSLESTKLFSERLAAEIRRLPGVAHTLVTVAEDTTHTPNVAKVVALLVDPDKRALSQFQLMEKTRREILEHADPVYRLNVAEVAPFSTGASSNAKIQVALVGSDMDLLTRFAGNITKKLKAVPEATDVDNSLVLGKPEIRVVIQRDRAAELGVRVADIADALRLFVGGAKVSTYAEEGEQYDIRLRAEEQYRADASTLGLITVPSTKRGFVALSNLVTFEKNEGPAEILRLGRMKQVTLYANSKGGADSKVQEALNRFAKEESLPVGYQLVPVGQSKEQGTLALNFLIVLGMSFVLMYLVLAAQFESWLHPLTILTSLPLTVPFALLSLLIFGQTLNIFSGLGLIVLFGVVKKNSILQIDHTNHLRKLGRPRLEAILEANRDRLRPILMTTLAFVAGMVPMLVGNGVGSGKNHAAAGIILGGQTFSLLLTLLAVPVIYSLFDDVSLWFKQFTTRFGGETFDDGRAEIDTVEAAE